MPQYTKWKMSLRYMMILSKIKKISTFATVPSKIKKGDYKLIVNIDEGGELIFYFITSAKIKSGTGSSNNCDPAYPDFCIKSPPPDLDCAHFTQKNFKVLPPDPHNLDGDGDGVGCES